MHILHPLHALHLTKSRHRSVGRVHQAMVPIRYRDCKSRLLNWRQVPVLYVQNARGCAKCTLAPEKVQVPVLAEYLWLYKAHISSYLTVEHSGDISFLLRDE